MKRQRSPERPGAVPDGCPYSRSRNVDGSSPGGICPTRMQRYGFFFGLQGSGVIRFASCVDDFEEISHGGWGEEVKTP